MRYTASAVKSTVNYLIEIGDLRTVVGVLIAAGKNDRDVNVNELFKILRKYNVPSLTSQLSGMIEDMIGCGLVYRASGGLHNSKEYEACIAELLQEHDPPMSFIRRNFCRLLRPAIIIPLLVAIIGAGVTVWKTIYEGSSESMRDSITERRNGGAAQTQPSTQKREGASTATLVLSHTI